MEDVTEINIVMTKYYSHHVSVYLDLQEQIVKQKCVNKNAKIKEFVITDNAFVVVDIRVLIVV